MHIHTMGYYSSVGKNKILPFVIKEMKLEETIQRQKDTYCMT